ncbi:antibiotic biosynthesis monooxygenase family protein, partial [Streptomyces niveiscabiei]|uniref:antibiotic biosynthesis monooxygenase family protein n=1 Tax=Streptomyces niveiscabiei TaxID=164115 RepID=UPI0038F75F4B
RTHPRPQPLRHHMIKPDDPGKRRGPETITEAGAFMRRQPGFRRFRLVRSVKSPESYLIYAEWDDVEVLETAIAQPEVRTRAAHVRGLTHGAPKIYEVVSEADLTT